MTVTRLPVPDPRVEADDRRAAIDAAVLRALGPFADRPTIDAPELAEVMRWSRSTAFEAIRSGVVPSIRVGRRVVVPVPALVALLLGVHSPRQATDPGGEARVDTH